MTERPARFWSKRFRQVLLAALRGKPFSALLALYWLATRRRVRGWGQLLLAASEAPYNYQRWTGSGEQRAIAEFQRFHSTRSEKPVVAVTVITGEGTQDSDIERTIESSRAALENSALVTSICVARKTRELRELACKNLQTWLLPILAGDTVSPILGDILARLPYDDFKLAYWDEDWLDHHVRSEPWIKPDWDPILFGRLHGLAGASVVSAAAVVEICEQIADLWLDRETLERTLTAIANARTPAHVPLVLTHRSAHNALKRNLPINSPSRDPVVEWPSISILVPTRDRVDLLEACLQGIERTEYSGSLELIVIDNRTRDAAALRLLRRVSKKSNVTVMRDDREFNFSRLNNSGASAARGELLCFLNNDVEIIHGDWLRNMVYHALGDDVGAVGAQLLYPSGRIQHAGVAIGAGGAAGHVQKGVDPSDHRFWTWHAVTRQVTAVTAAAMVIKKTKFVEVGGFDETSFPVAFNDVDLCLRLDRAGYRNIYTADARLLHHESESRGHDRSGAKAKRFAKELGQLQQRWQTKDYYDPHFSPLFSRAVERCVLAP